MDFTPRWPRSLAARATRPRAARVGSTRCGSKPTRPPGLAKAGRRNIEAPLSTSGGIDRDVLLASACLPQRFAPVQIGGMVYWDRRYASHLPLRALIEAGVLADVVIVRTTPIERSDVALAAAAVRERMVELAFGAALRQELQALAFARCWLAGVAALPAPAARLHAAYVHAIGAEVELGALGHGRNQVGHFGEG